MAADSAPASRSLSPALWARVSTLFDEGLALDGDARHAWLVALRQSQPEVAPWVARLLDASTDTQTLRLDAPSPGLVAAALAAGPAGADAAAYAPGQRFGPYRLFRHLADGGMSSVWIADQTENVQRRVALKLPRLRLEAPEQTAARFAAERDFLARLEHPHIGRLYDAGLSEGGVPYLAMELIEGQPITQDADARRLDIPARIALFRQALAAVRHAHARLIVHGDIKPGNVMVSTDGQVRLVDFGISDSVDDSAAPGSGPAARPRSFTPDAAAPEQLAGAPLDAACDVYSLGVVLYELLCGARPYALPVGRVADLHGALMALTIEPPSARLAPPGAPAGAAAGGVSATAAASSPPAPAGAALARSTPPHRLRRALQGDLDAIVAKAMAREPGQRYSSVEALDADLDRHLAMRPVAARPDSAAYVLGRYLRRHALVLGAACALLLTLAGGLASSLWQAGEARREAARAREVQAFLVAMFDDYRPEQSLGRSPSALEVLERGERRLALQHDLAPQVRADLHLAIGHVYLSLGRSATAETHIDAALEGYRAIGQGEDAPAIEAMYSRVEVLRERGELDLALEQALACRRVARQQLGAANAYELPLATQIVWVHYDRGELERGMQVAREGLMAAESASALGRPVDRADLLNLQGSLAEGLMESSRFEEARDRFAAVLAASHDAPGYSQQDRLTATYQWMRARFNLGEIDSLLAPLSELVGQLEQMNGPRHDRTLKARVLLTLALVDAGRYAEALASQRRVAIDAEQSDNDHAHGPAVTLMLARLLGEAGQASEALALARPALVRLTAEELQPRWIAERARWIVGELERAAGQSRAGLASLQQAVDRGRQIPGHDRNAGFGEMLLSLATALRDAGRTADAAAVLQESIEVQERSRGTGSPGALRSLAVQAWWAALDQPPGPAPLAAFEAAGQRYAGQLSPAHPARAEVSLISAQLAERAGLAPPAGLAEARAAWRQAMGRAPAERIGSLH